MKASENRILITHVGSLPCLAAGEKPPQDENMRESAATVVRKQRAWAKLFALVGGARRATRALSYR